MPTTVVGPFSSPHRAWAICANLGRGQGGSLWNLSSTFSWEEAAGMSVSSVVMGQSMPWAAAGDPHGWAWRFLQWLHLQWQSSGWVPLAWATWPLPNWGSSGCKNFLLCKGDQELHHPLELHHTVCQMAKFTRNQWLGLLCPILEHPYIGEGLVWLGKSAVLAAKPQVRGLWTYTSLGTDVPVEGCSHYLHPLPDYMPLAPQMRQHPSSCYSQGPPAVLSTRSVFLLGECATVSNPTGTRKRALDHRVSWHKPETTPIHAGVPWGGAPVAGDAPKFPLQLPWVLTNQPHHLVPSHPTRGNWWALSIPTLLSWLSSPWHRLHVTFCKEGLEDWAYPLSVPLWCEVP